MSVRAILSVLLSTLLLSACHNEPYQYPPLGVVALANQKTGVSNQYTYRNQKLSSFLSMSTDTIVYMKFHHSGDDLKSIVTDSTKASRKVTSFYRSGSTITDSTFLVDAVGRSLVSTRIINYNDQSKPLSIDIKTWTAGGMTEEIAELTWEDGNVTRLSTFNLSNGEKKPSLDLTIGYDDKSCVFTEDNNYLFTFALTELYWLSKNNPMVFNDGTTEKKYTYWYNKLDYPSVFDNDAGQRHGVTYKQIR